MINVYETNHRLISICCAQMFMAITRQVLRTKKERKERQAIQTQRDSKPEGKAQNSIKRNVVNSIVYACICCLFDMIAKVK